NDREPDLHQAHVAKDSTATYPLSLNRWILPVAVFGRSGRNSTQRGYLCGASLLLTCSCKVFFSESDGVWPGLSTTNALGLVSLFSTSAPTTAASSTESCETSPASTSAGET